jgi:hypothetical protein
MPRRIVGLLAFAWGLLVSSAGFAEEPQATFEPEQLKYFETHVRPLLIEKCYKCHSDKKQSGELRARGL